MDLIFQIVKNLKKEEIRHFKLSTKKYALNDEVRVAVLFDKIRISDLEEPDSEMVAALFPKDPENSNAFYRLKNGLKSELEKSLLNLHHDLDEKISTMNMMNLANVFSYKSQYPVSIAYLKKAEKIALKSEFYDLLDIIYGAIIELSHQFDDIDPFEYILKRRVNSEKNKIAQQTEHAIAGLRHKLRRSDISKNILDVSANLQEVLNELQIANEVYKLPKVKFRIHICIRDILLQKRDFVNLEEYLIKSLKDFEDEGFYTRSNHTSKISLISWIINTLTINKKWDKSIQYTQLLLEELNKYNKLYYEKFIWTYYQSLITNYMSSGRLKSAIDLLENLEDIPAQKKGKTSHKGVLFYDYGIYINLALCYYFENNLSVAIKQLSHLLSKDMYPRFSPEFQLSLNLLEMILHYESNHFDYVEHKVMEVRRQFKALLKREDYAEEKSFIKIMNMLVTKASPFNDKKVVTEIKTFIKNATGLQVGSGKHIDFKLWITAKLEKKSYYQTLLATLQSN